MVISNLDQSTPYQSNTPKMASTNPVPTTFLSALSPEMRNEIYFHVLSKNKNIFYTVTEDGSDIRVERAPLQNVNQQLRQEFGSLVLKAIRDKTWIFTYPALICALLDSAPEELSDIKKLKLQFSVGEALGFFSAKETFQFKDLEMVCKDFERL